jgi:major intracellular serine protease
MVIEKRSFWDLSGTKGESVKVALLDTGIDLNHPDFRQVSVQVKDFCNPGTGRAEDFDGHGTHCAGIICQVAPRCTLLCGQTRNNFFTYSGLGAGLKWAIEESADVVCICSGEHYADPSIHKLIQHVVNQKQITVIAAIGNQGRTGVSAGHYPAVYNEVIAVGSVNDQNELTDFTNVNPNVALVGLPGENIRSAWLGESYRECTGTSVSAALLCGVVALLISQQKRDMMPLSPALIKEKILKASIEKNSSRGRYWLLDAIRLVS